MERRRTAEDAIRWEIEQSGPITFRRFMELALYGGPTGYYSSGTERVGRSGDFLTSPEVHPAFGSLLARQLEQLWRAMGRPDPFPVVEMGAGRGSLALDILSYCAQWSPPLHNALAYTILEPNPTLADRQRELLASSSEAAAKVRWRITDSLDLPERSLEGCVVTNELLDAFPVHRVRNQSGALQELYVGVEGHRLVDVPGKPSDPALEEYFDRLGLLPPAGCKAEVNLDALQWMRRVASVLDRGAAITIDYGYPATDLYSRRHCDGTLLCFYRHTLNADPYARIGEQDITTHLDFTSLMAEAERLGLQQAGLTTQREFLRALGIDGYRRRLSALGLRRRDLDANGLAMDALVAPQGLGRIGVMIQVKGVDEFFPAGLRPDGFRPAELGRDFTLETPPLLRSQQLRLNASPTAELSQAETEDLWRDLMAEDDML
ncbi:MAG TPA: SAM-dependent methyltransferase [Chloroflexota bacterium]|nr:SAM-dependent methyltransferase [Chloroflexota bacterium]